jgi:hypothetical protein
MRVIDFFVFYVTTLYKNKPRGNLFWDSPVRRTMFVVGLTFTLLLFSILEIVVFLIAGINIMENRLSEIVAIIGGVLLIQLLGYVYIVKKRYEFIISSQYRAFTLNANLGVAICVVVSLFAFLLMIGVAGAIHIFLKTHGNGSG